MPRTMFPLILEWWKKKVKSWVINVTEVPIQNHVPPPDISTTHHLLRVDCASTYITMHFRYKSPFKAHNCPAKDRWLSGKESAC